MYLTKKEQVYLSKFPDKIFIWLYTNKKSVDWLRKKLRLKTNQSIYNWRYRNHINPDRSKQVLRIMEKFNAKSGDIRKNNRIV